MILETLLKNKQSSSLHGSNICIAVFKTQPPPPPKTSYHLGIVIHVPGITLVLV